MTVRWNADKRHRCPRCHAVAISGETPRWWRVYTCCRCGSRFTRWPRIARLLSDAGVCCGDHDSVRDGVLAEMRLRITGDLPEAMSRADVLAALTTEPGERTRTPKSKGTDADTR